MSVTVVIPAYNRAATIKRAIDSVLNQTYPDIHIIVVDDGSSDGTQQIVEQYAPKGVRLICHEKNKGACAARNTGVKAADTEYLAFLDSDDEWLPEKVEKQMEYLHETDSDIVFCSVLRVDKSRSVLYPAEEKIGDLHTQFLRGNFISTGMLLGKIECFKAELFDEALPRLQDWDLAIRLSKKYKMSHIPIPLAKYYLQEDSISTNHEKLKVAAKHILDKYRKEFIKDDIAYANICETLSIANIMTDGEDALVWIEEARRRNKTKKNAIIYIACKLHLEKLLKTLELRKLKKRCR